MNCDSDIICVRSEAAPSRVYSPDLQPLMQSLLAMLADIDFEYDRQCDTLNNLDDEGLRTRALETVRQMHRARREPYVQQLIILKDRIGRLSAS